MQQFFMADEVHVAVVLARLARHEELLSKSELFLKTTELLQPLGFTRIRCLALGSPTDEFQALYQLAYLKQIASKFAIDHVSLYDPVFSDNDRSLFESLHYAVEEPECSETPVVATTLYYMPHAPRDVTNKFVGEIEPQWILGNDLRVTVGTLSKVKFLDEYPILAHLVKKAELKDPLVVSDDGFVPVRRRRKNKLVYVEPELEYDFLLLFFSDVEIERIESADAPWKDSFSDLALNRIIHKSAKNDS